MSEELFLKNTADVAIDLNPDPDPEHVPVPVPDPALVLVLVLDLDVVVAVTDVVEVEVETEAEAAVINDAAIVEVNPDRDLCLILRPVSPDWGLFFKVTSG